MNNAIFVSINPVANPIWKLKYIMEISNVVHTPQKIEEEGEENNLFNEGKKQNMHIELVRCTN